MKPRYDPRIHHGRSIRRQGYDDSRHAHCIIVLHETAGAFLADAQSGGNGATDDNRAATRVAPALGDVIGAFDKTRTDPIAIRVCFAGLLQH